ncbi:MAG: hypothetical protein A3F89_06080 [Deltaproteobacteria bacterium RIFCSPLOWO2_12_FULL_50_11]|nr:MAG: hypothetical protein A2053_04070 [Deltaproteobacteria bacterium GWA2_50_8]OGQ66638.1 MAG: hypothetical protein A3F89_06080 [Deltaproteobacteria bacterium RIFCSPLOWO2_12_FULL_50_11]
MHSLFWIDLEMTGLDENIHAILEVAIVITDTNFNVIEEYSRVIHQSQEVMDRMDPWCQEHHGATGLTKEVKSGQHLVQVEKDILMLVDKHFTPSDRVVICGNSVGNDKRFIDKYMPALAGRLHYRVIDVSSFKEIFRQKYNFRLEKSGTHRALQDIYESIRELKTYLSYVHFPATETILPG